MCFTTVTAATVLVNVVYHGNESHGNGNCVFHCNVTTVITAVKSPREALNNILLIGSKGHAFVDKVLFDQDKCSRGEAFRLLYSFGACFHLRTRIQCFVRWANRNHSTYIHT